MSKVWSRITQKNILALTFFACIVIAVCLVLPVITTASPVAAKENTCHDRVKIINNDRWSNDMLEQRVNRWLSENSSKIEKVVKIELQIANGQGYTAVVMIHYIER